MSEAPKTWSTGQLLVAGVLAAAAGAVTMRVASSSEQPALPPVAPSATVSALPAASVSALSMPSVAPPIATAAEPASDRALAAGGDRLALKRLETKPARDRAPADALALLEGHEALAKADAIQLVADIRADESLLKDPATLAYAMRIASDGAAAPILLTELAATPQPVVADMVFELASKGDPASRLVLLSWDLLEGALRPAASKALLVLVDLRGARDCWQKGEVVMRAAEHADDRALAALEALTVETGCGRKRAEDCAPCLRAAPYEPKLSSAIERARATRFVAPWAKPERRGDRAAPP